MLETKNDVIVTPEKKTAEEVIREIPVKVDREKFKKNGDGSISKHNNQYFANLHGKKCDIIKGFGPFLTSELAKVEATKWADSKEIRIDWWNTISLF